MNYYYLIIAAESLTTCSMELLYWLVSNFIIALFKGEARISINKSVHEGL